MPQANDWHLHHHKVSKPANDADYLERMSRVIFMAGLNWRVLESKWPGIRQAFSDFDLATVAALQEPEIEELMHEPAVIHNLPKIRAIIANAKEMQGIIKEHGSFGQYLDALDNDGGEDRMRSELSKRFAFLGKGTTVLFLFSVGRNLPKAAAEWEARHQKP